jgi:hypothetical protein
MMASILICGAIFSSIFAIKVLIEHSDGVPLGLVKISKPFYPRLAAACLSEISIRDALKSTESRIDILQVLLKDSHYAECYQVERRGNLSEAKECRDQIKEILAVKLR